MISLRLKAFLSHGSPDKEFAVGVANELRRQYVVFDAQTFDNSVEFRDSIQKGLDQASIFVLFASRESLKRAWVVHEVDEAWYRRLERAIDSVIVLMIDPSVGPADLPPWLTRARTEKPSSVKQAARAVKHALDESVRARRHSHFMGRATQIQAIEEALRPLHGPPPSAVMLVGLPGIGRRTLARQIAANVLSLRRSVEVRLEVADTLTDLTIKFAAEVEPYATANGLQAIVSEIRRLEGAKCVSRIARCAQTMNSQGEVLLIIDEGGLVEPDGTVSRDWLDVFRVLMEQHCYFFVVSRRSPEVTGMPKLQIPPLKRSDCARLISTLCLDLNRTIGAVTAEELADFVRGYPPAAYFTAQQVREYGPEVVIADTKRLVEFRITAFLTHVRNTTLNHRQSAMLRLLETYRPLPMVVLAEAGGISLEECAASLTQLIDLAFVTLTQDGYYEVADPLGEVVHRIFEFPTREEHAAIEIALKRFLMQLDDQGRDRESVLPVLRCYQRAAMHSGQENRYSLEALSSDIAGVATHAYHEGDYEKCVEFAKVVLERKDEPEVRLLLVRALIRLERWDEVEKDLRELTSKVPIKEVSFLRGFMERRRGKPREAIAHFLNAERQGHAGVALSRELAQCYHLIGDSKEARRRLEGALAKAGDNRYLVDFWAKLAIELEDFPDARNALERLEAIDSPHFFLHRKAMYELATNDLIGARKSSIMAIDAFSGGRVPFELVSTLAWTYLLAGDVINAEQQVDRLEREYRGRNHDVQVGLRCKLLLARQDNKAAYTLSDGIRDKKAGYYLDIRREAIQGMLNSAATRDEERAKLRKELDGLMGPPFAPGQRAWPFSAVSLED